MSFIVPPTQRRETDRLSGERQGLEEWLDFQRATLLQKCAGLDGTRLCEAAVPPSNLSLLGLVRHMAEVERAWFHRCVAGEEIDYLYCSDASPDGDFELADPARAEEDLATFSSEVESARAIAAEHGLDEQFARGELSSTSAGSISTWSRSTPATTATPTCCAR